MLLEQIQKDIVSAMKSKDELRLNTLRSVKTALDRYRVDQRKTPDEAAELAILGMLCKQRKEAATAFRNGDRVTMAEREEAELAILQNYMPVAATHEEMETAISESLAGMNQSDLKKVMGLIMKSVQEKLAGKTIDKKWLSEAIRAWGNDKL